MKFDGRDQKGPVMWGSLPLGCVFEFVDRACVLFCSERLVSDVCLSDLRVCVHKCKVYTSRREF